jgi:hypothetical protein
MRSFQEYTKEPLPQKEGTLAEELTKQISEAYNGKSNLEMMRNILAEAEKGKREGTLSNEEIDQFYQTFSPMLDGIQRVYLRQIIDELKRI